MSVDKFKSTTDSFISKASNRNIAPICVMLLEQRFKEKRTLFIGRFSLSNFTPSSAILFPLRLSYLIIEPVFYFNILDRVREE